MKGYCPRCDKRCAIVDYPSEKGVFDNRKSKALAGIGRLFTGKVADCLITVKDTQTKCDTCGKHFGK